MNWDHIAGNWQQFSGNILQRWKKLTVNQLKIIAGNREHMSTEIQKSYAISKSAAEHQLDTWQERQNEAVYLTERATERNGAPQ